MGDITDDQIFDISQVTSAGQNMEVEPPATAGRRRRKNCGRRSSAKPRGRVRKATSDTGAKRGPTRQARAAAEAYVATAAAAAAAANAAAATPQRSGCGGCAKSETAEEVPLETVTAESEFTIDQQAEIYVSKIVPDPATTVYPERGSVQTAPCSDHAFEGSEEPPTPPPQRRRGGRAPRQTPVRRRRRKAVDGDERVVCKAQSGRWSSLLPLGTVVRRPSVKLVQLVAQAIHESPHRVLRVTHVYAALQNRYPYYGLQDKKGISSWKSSVRHALFQKWFMKLRPTSGMRETVRPRSFFWGLNYSNRPREWQMPRGLPGLFLPTDNEGEQRDNEASTLWSGLHLNTEPQSNTTTTLMPPAFRLELQHELFAPPEPLSPGDKRTLSTVQCTELPPVTSAAQSEDDLVSVGSPPSSLPHITPADLGKSESMNPVGWPAPGRTEKQALPQPSVNAWATPPSVWDSIYSQAPSAPPCSTTTTTSMTATTASQPTPEALVEAVVDSFQKPWQSLSSEPFMQLHQEEQQQQVMQQSLQEPPKQQQQQLLHMLQSPLQESQQEQQQQERQETFRDLLMEQTTQQGPVLPGWLRFLNATGPNNLFENITTDPQHMFWASVNYFVGLLGFGHDEPLSPCSPLRSPSYVGLTSPSQTPLATAPSTRAQTPSQQPPAIPGPSEMPEEQAGRLDNILSGYGLLSANDECFAIVNASLTIWNNLMRRGVVRRSAELLPSGERVRIAALVVAPPSTPRPTDDDNLGLPFSDEADRPSTSSDDGNSLPVYQADCGKPGSPPT